MKEIILTQGLVAQVDDSDWERLSGYKYYAHKHGGTYYAQRTVNGKKIKLHHDVMGSTRMFDHVDGNGLNCQRANIRPCSHAENMRNRRAWSKTGCKGCAKNGNKFTAYIRKDKQYYYLGRHNTLLEAARAYDAKAKELFGEFARLNFPEG